MKFDVDDLVYWEPLLSRPDTLLLT